jgi:hypothetical protein
MLFTKIRRANVFRAVLIVVILTAMLVPMTSCKKDEPAPTTMEPTTTSASEVPQQTTTLPSEKEIGDANPLTGLPHTSSKGVSARPVGIIINNIKIATPQAGIGSADLLYEIEVEGDITRLMAVFANPADVPEIGSVRSLRHDFIDLAGAFNAIVVHFGGSYAAYDQVMLQNTDHIDSSNADSAFWRDANWRSSRGYEHSVKTEGSNLVKAISSLKIEDKNSNDNQAWFYFQPDRTVVPDSGNNASKVTAPFSNYSVATFTYDEATQTYVKGQFNADQIDVANGEPLHFTNVLLLQTSVTQFNGDILKEYDLTSGSGYYVTGGKYELINWKKGYTNDPWIFTKADGSELVLNRGKTYIGISRYTKTINFR